MKYVKNILLILLLIGSVGFSGLMKADIDVDNDTYNYFEDGVNSIEIKLESRTAMIASWYGPKFHGKRTANGELYDQMAFTAAHKKLPFGTMLKITNPENGRTAIVRINDRGPYIEGRDIDLSRGVANALGMIEEGVIKVEVEQIIPSKQILPIAAL